MRPPQLELARNLQDRLSLERAIETGTYLGDGARALSQVFASVISIELSEELHRNAQQALSNVPNVRLVAGASEDVLSEVSADRVPTLYFLDGHWSGGTTEGAGRECPVINEIAAIGRGHPNDCILIDDSRLFTAAPPPPHDPEQWPSLLEVFDAIRGVRPDFHLTVLNDTVIAAPPEARPVVDEFGRGLQETNSSGRGKLRGLASSLRSRHSRD